MQHASVAEWLASLGLAQYAPAFATNDIEMDILSELSDPDLEKIGIASLGHRRKVLRAAAALGERTEPVASVPPAQPTPTLLTIDEPTAPRQSAAERRHLTVMFCDLVGSTALAARLDPEDVREVVRAYQSACAQVIGRYEGFVAQYLGDGIMAYFGYPAAHEDDAERAVRAGLDLVAAVATLDTATKVEVRVGIATGLVVVGDLIGEQGAKERAVTGETPNLAARLQGLAPPGSTVVSAATRRLLGGQFDLRDLGAQQVKGLDAPVSAFAVEGVRSFESRFEARAGGLTGFVGREEECEHLLGRWKLARQGRGQALLVSGEAGIGKSRLTAWLVDKVAGEPHTRLRFQCTPHHKDSALYPSIAQLERAADIEANEPGEAKLAKLEALLVLAETEAAETVPLFAALLAIPTGEKYPPLSMSPGQQRQRTLVALLDQVEALARQKPLLMVYEDAHWADETSLELLDSLVDRIARLPVLFVVTGRPEFAATWAGRHNVSAIWLQKLDRRDARAMAESVAGASLPADVLDQIITKTDGVPLFVEELTKTVLETGAVVEDGRGLKARSRLPIPATLQDSLMARLDKSNPVKEIAQIGAAIGREFSYRLLLAVAGMEEATVKIGLAKLEEAELATRRGVLPDASYTFKHALVQDAAYESLLKSRRQTVHRRIGKAPRDWFPLLAETEPEILAHHFTQAGKIEQAVEWWARAGERTLRRSAHTEAISHFEKAIELADQLPQDPQTRLPRVRLQISYAHSLMAGRGYGAPATTLAFSRARELVQEIEDAPERFSIYFGLWGSSFVRAEPDAMLEIADVFLREVAGQKESQEASVAHRVMGVTLLQRGDFVAAHELVEHSFALYNADRDRQSAFRFGHDIAVANSLHRASTLWALGEIERAYELSQRALELVLDSEHIQTRAWGLSVYSNLERGWRGPARALPHAKALATLSREHGLPVWLAFGNAVYGWARSRTGERQAGEADMHLGIEMARNQGVRIYNPPFAWMVADVEARSGRFESALKVLNDALSDNERTKIFLYDVELHRQRGAILLQCGPSALVNAENAFKQAVTTARAQQTPTWELLASLDLARLYCDTGREGKAVPLLQGALVGFTETPELLEIGEAQRLLESL